MIIIAHDYSLVKKQTKCAPALVAPWRKQNGMTQIYLKEKELQCQDNYQRIMAGFWALFHLRVGEYFHAAK